MATVIETVFAFIMLVMLGTGCGDICNGQTQIQRWKHDGGEDRACLAAWKEIFSSECPLLWLLPTPAFGDNPFE
jgi:hypothetical protein